VGGLEYHAKEFGFLPKRKDILILKFKKKKKLEKKVFEEKVQSFPRKIVGKYKT
jgi:hypothetical protein